MAQNKYLSAIDGGSFVGVSVRRSDSDVFPLGLVCIQSTSLSLTEFRQILEHQLPARPPQYSFFSKHGFLISNHQESLISVQSVLDDEGNIQIRRQFESALVGIELENSVSLGFVFINLDKTLEDLREVITEQLSGRDDPASTYQFLDARGWPVTGRQERELVVLDVLRAGERVWLRGKHSATRRGTKRHSLAATSFSGPSNTLITGFSSRSSSSSASSIIPYNGSADTSRISPALLYGGVHDEERRLSGPGVGGDGGEERKQVLISYVRVEAAQHALMLKAALLARGYSVFLDVHEIKSGVDWQDSLNFAVSSCQVFVPLVTPRYGETQWTNREVKLADVLAKFILPVCFLCHWPPRSLAIQFATTQFVPWRPDIPITNATPRFRAKEVCEEMKMWDEDDITLVADQLALRIEEYEKLNSTPNKMLKKMTSLRSCPVPLPEGFRELAEDRAGKPLVLVCAHPRQAKQSKTICEWLAGADYEVSCSLDLLPKDELESKFPLSQDTDKPKLSKDDTFEIPCLSQLSVLSDSGQPPESQARQRRLQQRADEAGVVVFLLSKAFAASRTSQQQVFYCESRKRVIVVRCEEFCMPGWLSMLIGTGHCEKFWCESFKTSLLKRVCEALDPDHKQCMSTQENERITQAAIELKKQLPAKVFVYISGGTTFYHNKSKQICKAVGQELASLYDQGIRLATGGFYGVGQTVAETYHAHCSKHKGGENADSGTVWHVLPERDDEDCTKEAAQRADKTFRAVPFGHTLYSGTCVRDRETIVSRVFDICILIEGGPGAAHEAEQFVWNDRPVIPVPCTRGAAAGKFNVPSEVKRMPRGVSKADWDALSDNDAPERRIGEAVRNIVLRVAKNLTTECLVKSQKPGTDCSSPEFTALKSPKRKRKKVANHGELVRNDTLILGQND